MADSERVYHYQIVQERKSQTEHFPMGWLGKLLSGWPVGIFEIGRSDRYEYLYLRKRNESL